MIIKVGVQFPTHLLFLVLDVNLDWKLWFFCPKPYFHTASLGKKPQFTAKLTYQAGTLNTLYQILLTEQVKNYKRHNDHHTARVLNYVVVDVRACHIFLGYELRNILIYVRHHIHVTLVAESG